MPQRPMVVQPVTSEFMRSELTFENQFSTGLCDCMSDCGSCCYAFFCPCCFLCSFDKNAKECCCTTCGLSILIGNGALMMNRSKLRGAYKIEGSLCEDCLLSVFCGFCVLLQLHNELKYHGDAF